MSATVRDIGAKTKRREPNQLFTDPADFRAPSPLEEGVRRRREGGRDQVKNGTAQVVWAEKREEGADQMGPPKLSGLCEPDKIGAPKLSATEWV